MRFGVLEAVGTRTTEFWYTIEGCGAVASAGEGRRLGTTVSRARGEVTRIMVGEVDGAGATVGSSNTRGAAGGACGRTIGGGGDLGSGVSLGPAGRGVWPRTRSGTVNGGAGDGICTTVGLMGGTTGAGVERSWTRTVRGCGCGALGSRRTVGIWK